MTEFAIGVLSGLVGTLFLAILVQIRTGMGLNWSNVKLYWSITRRLRENGVTNAFLTRSDYVNHRQQRSMADYVGTTKKELSYVGFWLAEGAEISNIERSFKSLLERECRIEIVFLDPSLSIDTLAKVANYLAISPESLLSRLTAAWNDMQTFKQSLFSEESERFLLKVHGELLTASAFVFDHGTVDAKTLIDIKIYGVGREGSFGIELKPTATSNSLYDRVTTSFRKVSKNAA